MENIFEEITKKGNTAKAFDLGAVNIRKVAEDYELLQRIIDGAKAAQDALSPTLLKEKVSENFADHEDKVIFVEGKILSSIDPGTVQRFVTPTVFAKIVSVSAASITKIFKTMEGEGFSEKAEVIIAKAKNVTGTGKDTVKVSKMTKDELKEAAAK